MLITDPFGGDVSQQIIVEHGNTETGYTGSPVDEVREEFDYFAHSILVQGEGETNDSDGLTDMRIIEAAYESAETGRRVEL